ncbi:MAG: hypothetical protein IDH49_15545, partial [Gammaproteobacteria bacterium]|nr:hypothetical protein [Gammaproteobacteria bacterium]
MSDPIGAVDAGLSVMQAQLGFQNMVNTSDPAAQINELAQMAAGFSNLINNPVASVAANAGAALVTIAKMELDAKTGKSPSVGDILSLAGNVVSVAAALAITLSPAGRAAGVLAKAAIGIGLWQVFGGISSASASGFTAAKTWAGDFRDPIILDLDGDGLETVGLTSNAYFDHDGDGVLTRTGWAGKDDALLVWDRNTNGQ